MKIKHIIMPMLCSLILSSCNDWFDVTASNEIREEDQFSTDMGFEQSAVGCYELMAEESLYGKYASIILPEIAAGPYLQNTSTNFTVELPYIQRMQWKSQQARPIVDNMWAQYYKVIVNANEALANIDAHEQKMDPINYHVVKGELLGIRAKMHFDLLRFFGYGDWANRKSELDAKLTIPYVTGVDKNAAPQVTGAEVIQDILKDLTDAEALMKDYDPACGVHSSDYYTSVNDEGYYNSRNFHMNYYAVIATEAQVYQWVGDYANALTAAKKVIDDIGTGRDVRFGNASVFTLHLMPVSEVNETTYPLTREAIFAVQVNDLASTINTYYPTSISEVNSRMTLDEDKINTLFNNSNTDDRLTTLLYHNTNLAIPVYIPLKYYTGGRGVDVSSSGTNVLNAYFRNSVNIIRLPEMYYIAAEAYARQGDVDNAESMLNTIRTTRGLYEPLTDLSVDEVLDEIGKEYQREFIEEGNAFFYFKRLGVENIPNPTKATMTDADYVLPYPEMETISGRQQ